MCQFFWIWSKIFVYLFPKKSHIGHPNLPNANTFAPGQSVIIKGTKNPGGANTLHTTTTGAQFIDDAAPGTTYDIFSGQTQRFYRDGNAELYSW